MPTVAIPDLIELSGLSANTTYTGGSAGGPKILGVIDGASYFDTSNDNLNGYLEEINENQDSYITIDGLNYDITRLYEPDSAAQVTTGIGGGGFTSNLVYMELYHAGTNTTRYFALFDDAVGNISNIYSIQTGTYSDASASDAKITNQQDNAIGTVCFCAGTMIATPDGLRDVADLEPGDRVITMDHGIQRLVWVGRKARDTSDPRSAPIRLRAGALNPGIPMRDLRVSPQHRILLRGKAGSEALIPAVKLTHLPWIAQEKGAEPETYVHLLFRSHEVVFANGAPAESLLLGPQSRASLPPGTRRLAEIVARRAARPARPVVERRAEVAAFFGTAPTEDRVLSPAI